MIDAFILPPSPRASATDWAGVIASQLAASTLEKLSALKCLPEIKSSTRTGSQLNSFPFRRYDGVTEDVGSPGGAATVWSSIVVTRLAGSGRLVPRGGARRSRCDSDMKCYRGTTRRDQKRSSGSSLDSCTRQDRDECSRLCIGITSSVRDLASALAETCGERPSAHSRDVESDVRSLAEPIDSPTLICSGVLNLVVVGSICFLAEEVGEGVGGERPPGEGAEFGDQDMARAQQGFVR